MIVQLVTWLYSVASWKLT